MTITDRDIRDQVQHATDASEGTYDVGAITRAIVQRWGRVDINDIDHDTFWALVGEHAVSDEDICGHGLLAGRSKWPDFSTLRRPDSTSGAVVMPGSRTDASG